MQEGPDLQGLLLHELQGALQRTGHDGTKQEEAVSKDVDSSEASHVDLGVV